MYGFNKSVGSKSSWVNRKNTVDKNAVKGYNKDEEVIRAIDNNKKISEINKQRAIELYYSFKNEGIYASDHFIEQYIEREFKNNGDLNYDFEKIIEIAKKEHNYVDMTNGRYVIYYDNIGIVKEGDKYITIIKGRVSKHWETIE